MAAPGSNPRVRPVELVVLAAILAGATGIVVLLATRDPLPAFVFLCVVFIVALVGFAMLALAIRPAPQQRDPDQLTPPEPDGGGSETEPSREPSPVDRPDGPGIQARSTS